MELTPELFEKTEFTERRKGYDIDQVETFLEQTGTALAQMLARVRHTEERAAHAEERLSQADAVLAEAEQRVAESEQRAAEATQRAEQAGRAAQKAQSEAAAAPGRAAEEAEVEQAAKTLLMAKRTADATVNEARGQAQSLLEDSQDRAQRQLSEANVEAAELIRRANEQAEAEYADRCAAALADVEGLEARRTQLGDVITQLEARLAGYRDELARTAEELVGLVDDTERLGARPNMSIPPDEVLSSSGGSIPPVADTPESPSDEFVEQPRGHTDAPDVVDGADAQIEPSPDPAPTDSRPVDAAESPDEQRATPAEDVGPSADGSVDEDAQYLDLTGQSTDAEAAGGDRWGPGSWSQVVADLDDEERDNDAAEVSGATVVDDRPTEAIDTAGGSRDRFMEELDSAVNEAVELDDDAMTAFFEGSSDSRARRFGWRR